MREHLTPALLHFLTEVNLHDAKRAKMTFEFGRIPSLALIFGGVCETQDGLTGERSDFAIKYVGLEGVEFSKNGVFEMDADITFMEVWADELHLASNGAFDHHLLFAHNHEMIVTFRDMEFGIMKHNDVRIEPRAGS